MPFPPARGCWSGQRPDMAVPNTGITAGPGERSASGWWWEHGENPLGNTGQSLRLSQRGGSRREPPVSPPSFPRQPHFLPRSFALPRFYHKAQKFAGSCCCSARKLWVFQPRGFADLRDRSDPLGKAFPSLHKHQIPTPAHFFRTKRAGRGQVPARM